MKFEKLRYMAFVLAVVAAASCSEEDDNIQVPEYTKFENPNWTVAAGPAPATAPADWTVAFGGGVESPDWRRAEPVPAERPVWTTPDMHIYPASMTAVIRMSPYILPSITDADLLAAFIGSECRGVAQQIHDAQGGVLYQIQVKGNQSEVGKVVFKYYCDVTKEAFVSADDLSFEADARLGNVDTPWVLTWDSQSDQPYYMDLDVKVDLSAFDEGAVADGDKVAAFVGDECRGVATAVQTDGGYAFDLRAWGRSLDERLTLKYYTSALKDVYVYGETVAFEHTVSKDIDLQLQEHGYMDLFVTVPEVLLPYVSDDDDVAAFVNGYPCSVVQDRLNGQYAVKMKGANGDKVSFRYYNDKLKYIFETADCVTYADAAAWGSASDYQEMPLATALKLVHMQGVFTVESYEAINTFLAEGDVMAAFVGDECRGVAVGDLFEGKLIFEMDILGTLGVQEQFTLRYYHKQNKYLFTCPRPFDFVAGGVLGTRYVSQGIEMNVVDNGKSE